MRDRTLQHFETMPNVEEHSETKCSWSVRKAEQCYAKDQQATTSNATGFKTDAINKIVPSAEECKDLP